MRPYRQGDIVDDLQVQYKSTGKAPAWAHTALTPVSILARHDPGMGDFQGTGIAEVHGQPEEFRVNGNGQTRA